jgi:hypothetical protein
MAGTLSMILPRWLVTSLLIATVLQVLGASACWWTWWPERTSQLINQAIIEGRVEDVFSFLGYDASTYGCADIIGNNHKELYRPGDNWGPVLTFYFRGVIGTVSTKTPSKSQYNIGHSNPAA